MVVRVSCTDVYVRLQGMVTLRPQLGYLLSNLRQLFITDWFLLVLYVLESQDV